MTHNPIPDCPGYYAGTDGNIYSNKSGELKMLKPHQGVRVKTMFVTVYSPGKKYIRINHDGHECKAMKPRSLPIYKLVLWAFHGIGPPGYQVEFINGNRQDTRPDNLRWAKKPTRNPRKTLTRRTAPTTA